MQPPTYNTGTLIELSLLSQEKLSFYKQKNNNQILYEDKNRLPRLNQNLRSHNLSGSSERHPNYSQKKKNK